MNEPPWPTNQETMAPREPTADEAERMRWWNGLTEPERAKASRGCGLEVWCRVDTESSRRMGVPQGKKTQAANVLSFTKKPQP
jgi:hypothetical protein